MLLKRLSSLRYLLREGLALRGHNEQESNLVQLLLLLGLLRWEEYLSHEMVNEMVVHLMPNHVLREMLGKIREALYFSLIADEA